MKKKGFTLIELLAVIVILAILAVIITPILANIIHNSRIASLRMSAYGVLDASRLYYAQNGLTSTVRFDIENSNVTSTDTDKMIEFKGDVKAGTLLIDGSGQTVLCLTDGKYSAYKNYTEDIITLAEESCYVPNDRTIVFLSNTGATRTELTNQELTDIVAELQSKINELEIKVNDTSTVLDKIYPIGSIYMSTTDDTVEKVSERFGGSWEVYASGRTLVGVDTTQEEFNTVNKTGGEKTHTLTIDETPSHTHTRGTMNITANAGSFGHTGGISYGINLDGSGMTGAFYSYGGTNTYVYSGTGTLYNNTQHHSGFGFDASRSWTGETSSVGGNGSHNNLQPYQTVYMYKRVG